MSKRGLAGSCGSAVGWKVGRSQAEPEIAALQGNPAQTLAQEDFEASEWPDSGWRVQEACAIAENWRSQATWEREKEKVPS